MSHFVFKDTQPCVTNTACYVRITMQLCAMLRARFKGQQPLSFFLSFFLSSFLPFLASPLSLSSSFFLTFFVHSLIFHVFLSFFFLTFRSVSIPPEGLRNSLCMSASNNSTHTKRIFMKYETGEFYGRLSFHLSFNLHRTVLTVISREHLDAFLSVGVKSRIPALHERSPNLVLDPNTSRESKIWFHVSQTPSPKNGNLVPHIVCFLFILATVLQYSVTRTTCHFSAVVRMRRNRRLSAVLDLWNSEIAIISTLYVLPHCSVPSSSLCLYPHSFSLP